MSTKQEERRAWYRANYGPAVKPALYTDKCETCEKPIRRALPGEVPDWASGEWADADASTSCGLRSHRPAAGDGPRDPCPNPECDFGVLPDGSYCPDLCHGEVCACSVGADHNAAEIPPEPRH